MKVHLIVWFKKKKESKRPLPVTIDSNGKNGTLLDGNAIGNGNVCELTLDENGHVAQSTKSGPGFALTCFGNRILDSCLGLLS